jgi:hypothetical protein
MSSKQRWGQLRVATNGTRTASAWNRSLTSWRALGRLVRTLELSAFASRLLLKARNWLYGSSFSALKAMLSGGPVGARGQYGGARSRTVAKSLHPRWEQRLELRLEGGDLNTATGEYDNADAPYTSLRLEVWDRDLLTSDDFIGEVSVPLCPCMDQRTHTYTLPLTDPEGKCSADGGLPEGCTITFDVAYES